MCTLCSVALWTYKAERLQIHVMTHMRINRLLAWRRNFQGHASRRLLQGRKGWEMLKFGGQWCCERGCSALDWPIVSWDWSRCPKTEWTWNEGPSCLRLSSWEAVAQLKLWVDNYTNGLCCIYTDCRLKKVVNGICIALARVFYNPTSEQQVSYLIPHKVHLIAVCKLTATVREMILPTKCDFYLD